MAKFFSKIKDPKHHFAIAIKKNYDAGMRPKDIAKLFNLSKQRVNYWLHHDIITKRKRREKLTRNERSFILKWAKDKPVNFASARKIQQKFNRLPKNKKENRIQKKNFLVNGRQNAKQIYIETKKNYKGFYLKYSCLFSF